ncbi:unnamed protein product [Staurois parvus]|uniref:Uncharacterized protein n=1 Tax=Staurois parvus TaxID=386267 RepID=A0ABN9AG68_9NEOB|nr:unnamed protein product [Staurois parvus]
MWHTPTPPPPPPPPPPPTDTNDGTLFLPLTPMMWHHSSHAAAPLFSSATGCSRGCSAPPPHW